MKIIGTSRSGHNFIKDNIESWTGNRPGDNENPRSGVNSNDNICIRDYLDTVASLAKIRISHIDISIKSWIYLASFFESESIIIYEEFKNSEEYRRKVCKRLNGNYNEDRIKESPKGGAISSFYKNEVGENGSHDDFYKKVKGRYHELKTTERWKQIQENPNDKEYYILKLRQFPKAIELYIKNYTLSEEKYNFLKNNAILCL